MRRIRLSLILALVVLVPTVLLADHQTSHPAELQDSINTPNFDYTIYYTNDDATDSDYFTKPESTEGMTLQQRNGR